MTSTMIPAELQAYRQDGRNGCKERKGSLKTEFAISVVTQAIKTQEAIAKGNVLRQLKMKSLMVSG